MSTEVPKKEPMTLLLDLTARLDAARIWHRVTKYRDDAVSITAHVPGQYWEIDVLQDGTVDVEVFTSTGLTDDPMDAVDRLIAENTSTS